MEKIKHLLPVVPQYFKANLHTHSTISDGHLPATEVKQRYQEAGYQILALTDHNIIVDHSELTEPDFLMLTGVEVNMNHTSYRPGFDGPTYHFNLIAKRPDNLWAPNKAPNRHPELTALVQYEGMDISHDPDTANAIIAKANEMGFLVMYNHPTWSCHSYPDYAPLKGLWGMELRNSECCQLGHNENNARVYKDLLNLGNRLFPLGTDDLHSPRALGQSWIMVGAQKLEYGCVMDTLERGDFYMSCGPEISRLTMEGNILKIACSDAKQINLESHGRFSRLQTAADGAYLREAEFDLTDFFRKGAGDPSVYVYLTVTAPDGTYAATRAYYLEELES